MKEERILFVCKCSDPAHQMIMGWFPEDSEDRCVWCEVLLNPEYSFFKRIANAIKYVFRPKLSRYGNFNEIILTKEHLKDLEKVTEYLKGS